jgi:hypothetical protein
VILQAQIACAVSQACLGRNRDANEGNGLFSKNACRFPRNNCASKAGTRTACAMKKRKRAA